MNILKRFASFLVMLFLLAPVAQESSAQFQIGPRVGIDLGDTEDIYVGVDARFSVAQLPVQINPTFDYYLVDQDNVSLMRFTANALYAFGFDNQLFTPYAGAGLSVARQSVEIGDQDESDTDTALNLVGGALFQFQSLRPFVQAELTVGGDLDLFGITGGLLFSLGR